MDGAHSTPHGLNSWYGHRSKPTPQSHRTIADQKRLDLGKNQPRHGGISSGEGSSHHDLPHRELLPAGTFDTGHHIRLRQLDMDRTSNTHNLSPRAVEIGSRSRLLHHAQGPTGRI